MKKFRPIVTSLTEVTIRRERDAAIIQYKDPAYGTTHLRIGPEVAEMSDQQIVHLYNDTLRAQAQLAAQYKHLVVEVPLGSPQIKYHVESDQWTPKGDPVALLDRRHVGKRRNGACNHGRRPRIELARVWAVDLHLRRLGDAHRVGGGQRNPSAAEVGSQRTEEPMNADRSRDRPGQS
jgi:hypothetical protein